MNKKCDFCTTLKLYKKADRDLNKIVNKGPKMHYQYCVAIVTRCWLNDKSKMSSMVDDKYKINYCPECGKELRRRKKNE